MDIQKIFLSLLIIAILLLTIKSFVKDFTLTNYEEKYKMQIQVLKDSVKHYKTKDGKNVAEINVLVSSKASLLKEIQSDKKIISTLKSEVNKYKNNTDVVTVIETVTVIDTLFDTDTVVTYIDSSGNKEIEYGIVFNDKWISINGFVNSKKTKLSIETNDEYSVAIVKDKKNYKAIVTSSSPYSSVKDVASYKVKLPKPKYFGIGIIAGYGLDFVSLRPAPFLGIGVSYNVFRF
jgi:hypothetical protein